MVHFLQTLLPYFVLFYILDCFIYSKKYQVALVSHFGEKYRFKPPGLRFFGISPFSRVFIAQSRPIFFNGKGIFLWNKSELREFDLYNYDSFCHIQFSEIKHVECDGNLLIINKELRFDLYLPMTANKIAERILTLKQTSPAKRLSEINAFLENDADLKKIKNKSESNNLITLMDLLSAFLFISIIVLIPAGLYFEQVVYLQFFMISTAAVCLLIFIFSYGYLQSRFKLSMHSVGQLVQLLLYPISAMHVGQHLNRHRLATSDYLMISAALLDPGEFRNILIRELKRIHFSMLKCEDHDLGEALEFRERLLHRFLPIAAVAKEEVFDRPHRQDHQAAGYCPFCETEFLEGFEVCPDCNIKLESYK